MLKTRFGEYVDHSTTPPQTLPNTTARMETFSSSRNRRGRYSTFNPCTHIKCVVPGSIYYDGQPYWTSASFVDYIPFDKLVNMALSRAYVELDFQKDNTFDLIPFFMDWDATIAMFSTKFLKQLSYGAVNWGVLPFISDLKSLAGSLSAIAGAIEASYGEILGKRVTRTCPVKFVTTERLTYGNADMIVNGKVHYSGFVTGGAKSFPDDPMRAILALLDEIGLNLDAKVLWDIIPLSFVADYFLPIGDTLETLHPRGWFNPEFSLDGHVSVSGTVQFQERPFARSVYTGTHQFYYRLRVPSLKLSSRPPVMPEFKTPTPTNLFNAAYLAASSRKK